MGEQPIEQQFREQMRAIADVLNEVFNGKLKGHDRTTGFALLVFPFGDTGRTNYISNAERKDMLNAMKEFIARAEGRILDSENLQ